MKKILVMILAVAIVPTLVNATDVRCNEISKEINEKTKYIAWEKVMEVERATSVKGARFVPSKKIPQLQSEISLYMQQGKDLDCPAYTGDLTGKPYYGIAKKCVESKFLSREYCDKTNWVTTQ